jgi:hypothetical protein
MADSNTADVPASWLAAVVKLLNTMAGDGISMEDCEDPCDLMIEIAEHLGVSTADDPWEAAVLKLAGVTNAGNETAAEVNARRTRALEELAREAQANGDYDPPGCEHLRKFINEQGAEIDRLRLALRDIRAAIHHPVNEQSIACTIWMHFPCPETMVDFIDATLDREAVTNDQR